MEIVLRLIVMYFGVSMLFLMLFMTGYLKLEMYSKKDRKATKEYRRIHILFLPILAISSIIASTKHRRRK